MYTITHHQGYNEPTDTELIESYEGEAKEIIFTHFIEEGYSDTVYTLDDVEDEEIELIVSQWLTKFEIQTLKTIEAHSTDTFWESLTLDTLLSLTTQAKTYTHQLREVA